MTSQAAQASSSSSASSPEAQAAAILKLKSAAVPLEEKKQALQFFSPQITSYFIAGGCAGAASRTVVSPLERLKIIQCVYFTPPYTFAGLRGAFRNPKTKCRFFFVSRWSYRQVQPHSQGGGEYKGVWASLVRMWREEGFKGFMRGNGINCLRIVPYRYAVSSISLILSGSLTPPLLSVASAVQFTTYEQLKKASNVNLLNKILPILMQLPPF